MNIILTEVAQFIWTIISLFQMEFLLFLSSLFNRRQHHQGAERTGQTKGRAVKPCPCIEYSQIGTAPKNIRSFFPSWREGLLTDVWSSVVMFFSIAISTHPVLLSG